MTSNRPRALQVFAGPRALAHLRERGLKPDDVSLIPAAAGGPKGLVLNPLDRFLFGHWLAGSTHRVHLLGASIGAWRMACATLPDADAALAQLADLYIHQSYDVPEGGWPDAAEVSRVFADLLGRQFGGREAEVLAHPRYRLHVFTSRGHGALLRREGRWRTPLGYAGAFAANLRERAALGRWLERVVFSDPRDALPLPLADFATRTVALDAANLGPALRASGAIPFVLQAVHDIPGAPPGAYWDGGITDYHLHLDYAAMSDGLVLYPHFQRALVPGWLDKGLKRRHAATPRLDNVVVLAPHPDWVKTLPGAKLPDRQDFKTYRHANAERLRAWHTAVAAAQQLADEAADWLAAPTQDALPL
jgi:hypothetical protein